MGKMSFAVAFVMSVMAGCASNAQQAVNPILEDGTVARASIESPTCGSAATIISLPEHCGWPAAQRYSRTLTKTANVVVAVDEKGAPSSARVVDRSPDDEANDAFVSCAMHGTYRPAWNGAGETCPLTIRLARYPSDVAALANEPWR
jgi:hypothetical protein